MVYGSIILLPFKFVRRDTSPYSSLHSESTSLKYRYRRWMLWVVENAAEGVGTVIGDRILDYDNSLKNFFEAGDPGKSILKEISRVTRSLSRYFS